MYIIESTANLRTKILDFRGFDSSILLSLRCGILMSIGDVQNVLSQQILVGIILVGRLGVRHHQTGCYSRPPFLGTPSVPSTPNLPTKILPAKIC